MFSSWKSLKLLVFDSGKIFSVQYVYVSYFEYSPLPEYQQIRLLTEGASILDLCVSEPQGKSLNIVSTKVHLRTFRILLCHHKDCLSNVIKISQLSRRAHSNCNSAPHTGFNLASRITDNCFGSTLFSNVSVKKILNTVTYFTRQRFVPVHCLKSTLEFCDANEVFPCR